MNARKDFRKPFDHRFDPRFVLAVARLRFAARVDFAVVRWLERCAGNAEAAQHLFGNDRKSTRVGMTKFVVLSPDWDDAVHSRGVERT